MDNIMFGDLLDKLLYLSNQKKGALAKSLGYDISYISKWINSKNLPSAKNANSICKEITEFIVDSLNESSTNDIIKYFEFKVDYDTDIKDFLLQNIEKYLKSSYFSTIGDKNTVPKETYTQDKYNSTNYINPRLRKRFLAKDLAEFMKKDEILEIILYINLPDISTEDKIPLLNIKDDFNEFEKKENLRIKFLTGFSYTDEDIIINSMIILNMITSHPQLNFDIYNCEVAKGTTMVIIKDKLIYVGIIRSDGVSLMVNTSKEKPVVNELYFSTESMLQSKGNQICSKKNSIDLIKDTTYLQYIICQNLKWLISSINELFMPEDLFIEIATSVFGDDKELLEELKKVNIFLHNLTYNSNLKVLIYESAIKKYILTGELNFFNTNVTLNFNQRVQHIIYLKEIMGKNKDSEIRIINSNLENEIHNLENISLFLSNDIKLIGINSIHNVQNNGYITALDDEFKNMCNDLFDTIWNKCNLPYEDVINMTEKISSTINSMKTLNKKF